MPEKKSPLPRTGERVCPVQSKVEYSPHLTILIRKLSYAFHKPCRLQYSLAVT